MNFKPILPPKNGYVEVIDIATGEHVYKPTPETEERMALQKELTLTKAQLKAQTDRSDFLEDCLAEMASIVYV